MQSTATTAVSLVARAPRPSQRSSALRFVGLVIASLVPAIFWCTVIGLAAKWLGFGLSMTTLSIIGGLVAIFLFLVCAPLLLQTPGRGLTAESEEASSS